MGDGSEVTSCVEGDDPRPKFVFVFFHFFSVFPLAGTVGNYVRAIYRSGRL